MLQVAPMIDRYTWPQGRREKAMVMMHVVSVCHHGGQAEKLAIASGSSSLELANVLCALFKIPSHERVVGLVAATGDNAIVIPLSAACRYPNLIFREKQRLGTTFRLVTKDAGGEEELLFPISALTPPPPPGRSHLSPTWASCAPELRVNTAETIMVPELVRNGCLTPRQGVAVVDMIHAEDPVVFAACRVAGAAAAATAAAAGSGGGGGGGGAGGTSIAPVAVSGEARSRVWSVEAKKSFASMLKIVLLDRERREVAAGMTKEGRGSLDFGRTKCGVSCQGGKLAPGERANDKHGEEGLCQEEGQSFVDGGLGGRQGRDSRIVPEPFQSDTIALADAALVTGKITQKCYVRALFKAVTLDRTLVAAYVTDLEEQQHQNGRQDGEYVPHSTLAAFITREHRSAANSTDAAAVVAQSESRSASVVPRVGGMETAARAMSSHLGQGGVAGATGVNNISEGLLARETELRDDFLRQALSLIEDGSDGFSERHRAIAQHAISVGHPWVSAIYDECKETGDVRGLMKNLQCLPALLERDQAAAFAANTSQPPPPGEADSIFWPRHHQQVQSQSEPQPPSQLRQQPERRRQPQQKQRIANKFNSGMVPPMPSVKKPDAGASRRVAMEIAPTLAAPKALGGRDSAHAHEVMGKEAAESTGGGGSAGSQAGTPAFDMVVEQLCRVIAGCSQLLVLRGVIGEQEKQALSVMSARGSPVLLAAVEAYGANQDLEDLLHTLQTAAEVELSLTATAAATPIRIPDKTTANSTQRQALPHRLRSPKQLVQQSPPTATAAASSTPAAAVAVDGVDCSADTSLAISVHDDRSGDSSNGSNSEDEDSTASRDEDSYSVLGDDSSVAGEDAATESMRSCAGSETRDSGPATVRTAAVGARAQELAAARFAGIRSAAEAKGAAAAGDSKTSPGMEAGSRSASSSGKGAESESISGDRRLRQDLSRLVAVMVKQGLLTDRQRLFLLAQVGRRITKAAREGHARYLETGNSKELYTVLMTLSTPLQKSAEQLDGAGGEESDDEEEEEENEDQDNAEAEDEKRQGKQDASEKRLVKEAGVEGVIGANGSGFGRAKSQATLYDASGLDGPSETCDAPEL